MSYEEHEEHCEEKHRSMMNLIVIISTVLGRSEGIYCACNKSKNLFIACVP